MSNEKYSERVIENLKKTIDTNIKKNRPELLQSILDYREKSQYDAALAAALELEDRFSADLNITEKNEIALSKRLGNYEN